MFPSESSQTIKLKPGNGDDSLAYSSTAVTSLKRRLKRMVDLDIAEMNLADGALLNHGYDIK